MRPLAASFPPPPSRSRRPAQRLLRAFAFAFLFGAVVFAAISFYFARRFTSPVPRPVAHFRDVLPATTESIRFPARDGVSLSGWFVPAPPASSPSPARAAILLHGHGSTRRQTLARAALFHREGYAVLLYDARGHGESGGDRVSIGWFETRDLLGALDYARSRGASEIGLLGISQGAATIALAARELSPEVRWVVLESMYPTLRDAVDRRFRRTLGLPGWLGALLMVPFAELRLGVSIDAIAPLDHISSLNRPVFILHGDRDTHTLPASAEILFSRAITPKSLWIVPGAAHNDLYGAAKTDYENRLLAFIRAPVSALP